MNTDGSAYHVDRSARADQIIDAFDRSAADYDAWFDRNPAVFESEVEALRSLPPTDGIGLEVGVGTGRFAERLGIHHGVEPAAAMAAFARRRGIEVVEAPGASLPYPDTPSARSMVLHAGDDPLLRFAHLRSVDWYRNLLERCGFIITTIVQTLTHDPSAIDAPEPVLPGYGSGLFVAMSASFGHHGSE